MSELVIDAPLSTDPNPPEELCTALLKRSGSLQMIPAVAMKALSMAKDPNCSSAAFAAVVERDTRLAADILRVANSVLYGTSNPILSLQQAVVRLGFAKCRNLIFAASLGSLMRRMPLAEVWMQEVLWRHSVITSLIAVRLNKTFQLGFGGEELVAGLVHDVGRSLIGIVRPDEFPEADPLDFEETGNIIERERTILGTDHCEFGAWFLKKNKLPDTLADVVQFHHDPTQAGDSKRLASLVGVADDMANHLQRCETSEGYDPYSNRMVELLFDSSPQRQSYLDQACEVMDLSLKDASSPNNPFALA